MRYESSARPDASGTPSTGTPSTARPTSRRRLLGVSGAALLTAACSATSKHSGGKASKQPGPTSSSAPTGEAPNGALGLNFNEDPSDLDFAEMTALSAKWVRGFVPMTDDLDTLAATQQRAVAKLLDASGNGFRTILSMKFQFRTPARPLPEAGSAEMAAQLKRVDRVLDAVMGKTDILTIGNEPFLETMKDERDSRLNVFYEYIAEHVIAYRKRKFPQGCRTRLYMGALNHLDRKEERTQATERWVAFVNRKPEIEGLDMHPHVDSLQAAGQYVQYVVSRLDKGKKFLATEFSLVLLWQKHMGDPIPAAYAQKYRVPPNTRVWQVIGNAIKKPFPQERWDDFLTMSPWFVSNKDYLTQQVQMFRETGKLAVATYGAVQIESMQTGWGADKMPWILNPPYANRTVREENGRVGRTTVWYESFRGLQDS
ncbi:MULTISPECIES: hypothetical protein [unclassified Streptomyces]|uniref:hypothetical protein n=1 Tax=unclassified Streptomyces TaxID=2593676 RepID=UPI002E0E6FB2|nr:hypothetical protein OG452_19760 [Streptomyces sp. NBC_01197]WSS49922.1 hypothetical protein OG708_15495 [Streptomyces sp. NBC_01180]